MKANLTIGKWGLIAVIWLFIFLTINGMIDEMTLIKFSIGLFYAIVIISVGFWLFSVVENPRGAVLFIVRYALLGLLLYFCYAVSDVSYDDAGELIEGSQFTEGGIYTLYTVTVTAVVVIILSELKRILKV